MHQALCPMQSSEAYGIFEQAIIDYHRYDDVNKSIKNPYESSIQALLYEKNWVDTVQWHLEDIIRNPDIEPAEGLALKRRIDSSNQHRTNIVEKIDDYYIEMLNNFKPQADARLNTESPGWVLDRLSILALKIYHMNEEATRTSADSDHKAKCSLKLSVLLEQKSDLFLAFDQLLKDIQAGKRYTRVYRQMKMYNDETLNPILYARKN